MRLLLVVVTERLCRILDAIPRYCEGRWYRHGDWGCQLGLAMLSYRLDERWGTGSWT